MADVPGVPNLGPLDAVRVVASDALPDDAKPVPLPDGTLVVSRKTFEALKRHIRSDNA